MIRAQVVAAFPLKGKRSATPAPRALRGGSGCGTGECDGSPDNPRHYGSASFTVPQDENTERISLERTSPSAAPWVIDETITYRAWVRGIYDIGFYMQLAMSSSVEWFESMRAVADSDFTHTMELTGLTFHSGSADSDALEVDYAFDHGTQVSGAGATPVPEPLSVLLLGTGLAGIGLVHRRRRSQAETIG